MSRAQPPPTPADAPAPRSGALDLWRALACLAVVAYHAAGNYRGEDAHAAVRFLNSLASPGHYGVDVFFVISGYCLAESVESRARTRRAGVIDFWRDRFLRIFPVYWAALLLALGLALAAQPFNGVPLSTHLRPEPLFWPSNLALITAWTGSYSLLLVSWSLNYEIGFYLLLGFALLTPFASPRRRLLFYATLTACAHLPGVGETFPLLSLWPAFACGLALRLANGDELPAAGRAAAALYPALAFALHPGGTFFAALFAYGLLLHLRLAPRLPAPPRFLVLLGLASYSIYLVHVPLSSPFANLARRFIDPSSAAYLAVWFGQIFVSVAGGLVFHRLVERPLENLRHRLRARPAARDTKQPAGAA